MSWFNILTATISVVISLTLFLSIGWKAWAKLTTMVNNFGDRLNRTELDVKSNETEIIAIRNELRFERDMIFTTMNNNETKASERHADLRVQFARMEERLDIEKLVRAITREVKNQG